MKKLQLLIGLAVLLFSVGCKDMLKPEIENNLDLESTYNNATYAQGLLLNGYARIPTNSWSFNDVATDDAVSNDRNNAYLKIATGQWTAINNPLSQWVNSRAAIQYLNLFFSVTDQVKWAVEPNINRMFNDRMKGEGYALRAMFNYYLLQAHAGKGNNGQLLGIPVVLQPEGQDADFNKPRATFDATMEQIYRDLDMAEQLLPVDFEDIASDAQIPAKYSGVGKDNYNRVFGYYFRGRVTARIAKAIRAKASLLAASPAFNPSAVAKWEKAANDAAAVIDLRGGLVNLNANDIKWYDKDAGIEGLASGVNPSEILWRSDVGNSNDLERNNFPPTLFGSGRVNPTQNLVNAFPMANGYPIGEANSGFSASSPYDNRDPRLKLYILVNGGTAGTAGTAINTTLNGPTNDALNKVETSTRTGYYMRKLLRQDVNLNPSSTTNQKHYNPRIRYTEIYLSYAEAANEAWGPLNGGTHAYSAYDVIKAIRRRAGVGTNNNDPYLESIKSDQVKMRELIRNERRLELCFEGFRFWDLRRWNTSLTEVAQGVSISGTTFTPINVENRVYQPYMIYGPIPYSEILKYNNLIQNAGW
ncbi:Starch-binding associating with outer membrane [Pedobacter terrae]|uniref:Starch-binding associating with outer membrane n=1 Tax=Pedobacter terrae TaxID=405671 RepID=A0A1G8CS30_9SPHI|nr:RagB/SusD family nutrient uptake outer membrane protein [Pedobacter terrae]SDH48238.1 Starch-binding associating with outer membrane [Pedobacter terrae]